MSDPVDIRAASAADAPRLAELATQLGYPSTEAEVARRLPRALAREPSAVLVAELGGRVVGWVQVEMPAYLTCDDAAYVIDLVVDGLCRGRGVGGLLLEACEAWARARGAKAMRIRCNIVRERTHGFYRERGYEVAKTQHQFRRELADEPDA